MAEAPEQERPRRSLGFWIISPWRHIMVSIWVIPMFMYICQAQQERMGLLLRACFLAFIADLIASRYAPDMRLKHKDMAELQVQGLPFCCVTQRDIMVRFGIVATVLGLIFYITYRLYVNSIDTFTAQVSVGTIVGIALTVVSVMGVRIRSISHLPVDNPIFVLTPFMKSILYITSRGRKLFPKGTDDPRFDNMLRMLKHVLLVLFGWPGFFYFLTCFSTWGGLVSLSGWQGTLELQIAVLFSFYGPFFLCVMLTPSAYAYSKMKPYRGDKNMPVSASYAL